MLNFACRTKQKFKCITPYQYITLTLIRTLYKTDYRNIIIYLKKKKPVSRSEGKVYAIT